MNRRGSSTDRALQVIGFTGPERLAAEVQFHADHLPAYYRVAARYRKWWGLGHEYDLEFCQVVCGAARTLLAHPSPLLEGEDFVSATVALAHGELELWVKDKLGLDHEGAAHDRTQ